MTLVVTDEPPDRPAWVSETIRLLAEGMDGWRAQLLERVSRASDAQLAAGTDDDWGVGQIAVHLLLIERGVVQRLQVDHQNRGCIHVAPLSKAGATSDQDKLHEFVRCSPEAPFRRSG